MLDTSGADDSSKTAEVLKEEGALREEQLLICFQMMDNFLDPYEKASMAGRYEAAEVLESFLRKFPEFQMPVLQMLEVFVPPEGYSLGLDKVFAGFEPEEDENFPRGEGFAEAFPLIFSLLQRVQSMWKDNVKLHTTRRVTRDMIQKQDVLMTTSFEEKI